MFENLDPPPADAILALAAMVADDPRADKIDLTVGVYKDDDGKTPVMESVRRAEQRLVREQDTKAYRGLLGDPEFNAPLRDLVIGDATPPERVGMAQTPGGSGALRVLSELVRFDAPHAAVWLSDPTWANHLPLLGATGLRCETYPYFDPPTQSIRFDALCDAIGLMNHGDVMVLHGCCHNPTGCDLTPEQWTEVAERLAGRGVTPLIDLAYHGLGDGLERDAEGVRETARRCPTTLVSVSCSKSFGVYRDRVGCALVATESARVADVVAARMGWIARTMYSMPPDHGAAVVKNVLMDDESRAAWERELEAMQRRLKELRGALSDGLCARSGSQRWRFIAGQKGMFSLLGLSDRGIERLRDEHAIYVVGGGRINIAGLTFERMERVAQALIEVGE